MVNTIIRIRMLKIFYHISQIYIFFSSQIKYSIDKNQLRLSGEEERNDKIKRKMTTALRILKKIKLLKRKLIF